MARKKSSADGIASADPNSEGTLSVVPTAAEVTEARRATNGLYCERLDAFAHEVIQSSVACMKGDRASREKVFRRMLFAYSCVFLVGLGAFAAALIKGLMKDSDAATTAVFAGLSSVSFASIFLFRPLATLKKNSISQTWLNVVTTTYWTRHYDLNKRGLLGDNLEKATLDTLRQLEQLLELSQSGSRKEREATGRRLAPMNGRGSAQETMAADDDPVPGLNLGMNGSSASGGGTAVSATGTSAA